MAGVSVDLGSGTTVGTSATIGVEPLPNWTQQFGFPDFTASDLEDNTGTPTTLDLTADGNGNIDTRASGSGDLFNMFTRALRMQNTQTALAFSQVPYSTYDVIVYFCETTSSTSGTASFTDGTTTKYYAIQGADNFNGGTLTEVTSTDSGSPDTVGNYVRFYGRTASTADITVVAPDAVSLSLVGVQLVEANTGATVTATVTEAGDTVAATIATVVQVTAAVSEAGDGLAASISALEGAVLSAAVNEAGDAASAALATVLQITATVTEAGDGATAVVSPVAQLSAVIPEAGDTVVAAVNALEGATITATVTESGDTVAAALAPVVQVTAAVSEAGDGVAASISPVVQTTAAVPEAGDVLIAAIAPVVQLTVLVSEAGDGLTAALAEQPVATVTATVVEAGDSAVVWIGLPPRGKPIKVTTGQRRFQVTTGQRRYVV